MGRYKVVWSESALKDLKKILAFVHGTSPGIEKKLIEAIFSREEQLATFPGTGANEPSLLGDFKFIIEGHYKIVYEIIGQAVNISCVFDTRQDPDKLKQP